MVEKVSFALGVAVLGIFLRWLNYVPTTGGTFIEQPPSAILALKLGFAVIPAAMFAINGVFLWFCDLYEKRMEEARIAATAGR